MKPKLNIFCHLITQFRWTTLPLTYYLQKMIKKITLKKNVEINKKRR